MRIEYTLSLIVLLVCLNLQSYAQNHDILNPPITNRNQQPITEDTTLPKGSTITTTINAATQCNLDCFDKHFLQTYQFG